jgi:hypothetical protein
VLFNLKKRDQKRERENEGDQRDQGPKREHPKNLPSRGPSSAHMFGTRYDYIADLKINNYDINNFHYILQSHSLISKL